MAVVASSHWRLICALQCAQSSSSGKQKSACGFCLAGAASPAGRSKPVLDARWESSLAQAMMMQTRPRRCETSTGRYNRKRSTPTTTVSRSRTFRFLPDAITACKQMVCASIELTSQSTKHRLQRPVGFVRRAVKQLPSKRFTIANDQGLEQGIKTRATGKSGSGWRRTLADLLQQRGKPNCRIGLARLDFSASLFERLAWDIRRFAPPVFGVRVKPSRRA